MKKLKKFFKKHGFGALVGFVLFYALHLMIEGMLVSALGVKLGILQVA